jgi:hypothetical protein
MALWWFQAMVVGRGSGGGEGLRRCGWAGDQGSGRGSSGDGRMGCVAGRIVGICCNAGWVGYCWEHPIISIEHQGIESREDMVRCPGYRWIFHRIWWNQQLFAQIQTPASWPPLAKFSRNIMPDFRTRDTHADLLVREDQHFRATI